MNRWGSRFSVASLILAAIFVHSWATSGMPNTPLGMLMFHGTGALVDLFMLYSAPAVLYGRLCADTQKLLLASIVGNFAGWLLYVAYVSPMFYDAYMWILTYVQLLRLFIPDSHVDTLGLDLVRHPDHIGSGNHP